MAPSKPDLNAAALSLGLTHKPKEGFSDKFKLSEAFVAAFKGKKPPFGFNGLGELVYRRTYSRVKEEEVFNRIIKRNEEWWETCRRVVEGTYQMQKAWIQDHHLGWDAERAQRSAQEMYSRIFEMKFLPPGRGLWAMGTAITEEKKLYAALNNCAFVSTENLNERPAQPFVFLMDSAMLGVGVGFDTKGAGSIVVKGPSEPAVEHVIADSREGWVDSLRVLIEAYLLGKPRPKFDYKRIRLAGQPIKAFGGESSGPDCLIQMHDSIRKALDRDLGKPISITSIVDIMNFIGRCVVAGNVRRTAEIAFGESTSDEFLDLKNYTLNPQRMEYGWNSNNSVFAPLGMDYGPVCERIRNNGEPGFAWLRNMQAYGRMNGVPDFKDERARGGNPCLEQTLESYELCCLVETFPAKHESFDDFKKTLKYAYLYAKTVTLGRTHWEEANQVMLRNRRIGCSMSGIAQFITKFGLDALRQWCSDGYSAIQEYDAAFSEWLAIRTSIKTTSIKPSGTVSLLAGATPGMHYPESRFYIRRVRLGAKSDLVPALKAAGYTVEPSATDPINTVVVEFPVDCGEGIRTSKDIPMWEQLSLAAFLQKYWADNQVSCTVTFDPATEGPQLKHALDFFQYQLKGVSFLPRTPLGAYPQMPYEEIDETTYSAMLAKLQPLNLSNVKTKDPDMELFCDSTSCTIEDDSTRYKNGKDASIPDLVVAQQN